MKVRYFILSAVFLFAVSCMQKNVPGEYGTFPNSGGFEVLPYIEQETPPGMILIEGGTFTLKTEGAPAEEKKMKSFYISSHEETNEQYMGYLTFMQKYYSKNTCLKCLPDTAVWLRENLADSLKNYLMKTYLRSSCYRNYPVVGLTPAQIEKYLKWKTDRLNEMILIREGILDFDTLAADSNHLFSTSEYFSGKFEGKVQNLIPRPDGTARQVRMEDGILLPSFRLPEQEEWELAALAVGDKNHSYIITPAESHYRKFDKKNYYGFLYVKNKPPKCSEAVQNVPPMPVYSTRKNNYFIYGMADNVSELLQDGKDYCVMGGSWKSPYNDYAAVYNKTAPDSIKYTFPFKFKLSYKENFVSAATGFRTAMDFANGTVEKLSYKRRKAKK